MHLTPQERDKLLIFVAAELARARQARGLKLNVPQATALITSHLLELARAGKSVADVVSAGRGILHRQDVVDGVAPDGAGCKGRSMPRTLSRILSWTLAGTGSSSAGPPRQPCSAGCAASSQAKPMT